MLDKTSLGIPSPARVRAGPAAPTDGVLHLTHVGASLLSDLEPLRKRPVALDAGEPAFDYCSATPADRMEAMCRTRLPRNLYPPSLRETMDQVHSLQLLAVARPPEGRHDYRPMYTVAMPSLLVRFIENESAEIEHMARKMRHCDKRGRARRAGRGPNPASGALIDERLQALMWLRRFTQNAVLECLPAVVDALRQVGEPDLSEFVAETLSVMREEHRRRNGSGSGSVGELRTTIVVARMINPILGRLHTPPAWVDPPESGPAPFSNADTLQHDMLVHFERLKWAIDARVVLQHHCGNNPLTLGRDWIAAGIASVQPVLEQLCEQEVRAYGRQLPENMLRQAARARRAFEGVTAASGDAVANEAALGQAFSLWYEASDACVKWLLARTSRTTDAALIALFLPALAAKPKPKPDADIEAVVSRRPRRPRKVPEPEPEPALPEPQAEPVQPPALRVRPARVASQVPAAGAARSIQAMPVCDAISRLDAAAGGTSSEAEAALHDFLQGRRLRNVLATCPMPQVALLVVSLADVVDACAGRPAGLGFFMLRDLLDGAWVAADPEARAQLIDSVLRHFADGPRAGEKRYGFRAFCLGGGIEKLLQVLPEADPAVARSALLALEMRLALQQQDEEGAAPADLTQLSRDLQDSIRQRRLNYMAVYESLGNDEREASAGDLRAWLANAIHALAPHSDAPSVGSLAARLCGLCGVEPEVLSRRRRGEGLQAAALRILTGDGSANCKLDRAQQRVWINAHNLDTPLFEALMQELVKRTTASGQPAFTAFELVVGGTHDDGGRPDLRKRDALTRVMHTLRPGWVAQHQGGSVVYLHDGHRPRSDWATWQTARTADPS